MEKLVSIVNGMRTDFGQVLGHAVTGKVQGVFYIGQRSR